MSPDTPVLSERDAYTQARRTQPGCQHNLGCKCDPPYWLRPSSAVEEQREMLQRLSPAQWDFTLTALRVLEVRRDELKAKLEVLQHEAPKT